MPLCQLVWLLTISQLFHPFVLHEIDMVLQRQNQKLLYEPKGVCALITPWNWPINQVNLKVIPALASACTVVLKPSEVAPLSSMLLAEMIDDFKSTINSELLANKIASDSQHGWWMKFL